MFSRVQHFILVLAVVLQVTSAARPKQGPYEDTKDRKQPPVLPPLPDSSNPQTGPGPQGSYGGGYPGGNGGQVPHGGGNGGQLPHGGGNKGGLHTLPTCQRICPYKPPCFDKCPKGSRCVDYVPAACVVQPFPTPIPQSERRPIGKPFPGLCDVKKTCLPQGKPGCESLQCSYGTVCKYVTPAQCYKPPCYPQPQCVPNTQHDGLVDPPPPNQGDDKAFSKGSHAGHNHKAGGH